MSRQRLDKRIVLAEFMLKCAREAGKGMLALISAFGTSVLWGSKNNVLIYSPWFSRLTVIIISSSHYLPVNLTDEDFIYGSIRRNFGNPTVRAPRGSSLSL